MIAIPIGDSNVAYRAFVHRDRYKVESFLSKQAEETKEERDGRAVGVKMKSPLAPAPPARPQEDVKGLRRTR